MVDPGIIRALYRASQAGVQIDLIIRGFCCLRPEVKGVSDNIRVKSIVGRFLEHSRIYYFHNKDKPDIYVGSADPMPRNINRRVEVLFPIEDEPERQQIISILAVYLHDTAKAHRLRSDGRYEPVINTLPEGEEPFNSQLWLLYGRHSEEEPPFDPNVLPPVCDEQEQGQKQEKKEEKSKQVA